MEQQRRGFTLLIGTLLDLQARRQARPGYRFDPVTFGQKRAAENKKSG